jgi:hypothetical protein
MRAFHTLNVKTALLALACCVFVLALPQGARADTFKVYPGAILDQKLTADAQKSQQGKAFAVRVYRTTDSFEKVRAFYAPLYHDTHVSKGRLTLANITESANEPPKPMEQSVSLPIDGVELRRKNEERALIQWAPSR